MYNEIESPVQVLKDSLKYTEETIYQIVQDSERLKQRISINCKSIEQHLTNKSKLEDAIRKLEGK